MAKKRPSVINEDLLEFLKFLHLHNLVNLLCIIDSIPIYYQTQIKKFSIVDSTNSNSSSNQNQQQSRVVYADDKDNEFNNVDIQKTRLQKLIYIATSIFKVKFDGIYLDYQTFRDGPHSLDLDNQLNYVVFSPIFNNAISSKKTIQKRYNLYDYDKNRIISMFNNSKSNYHYFLQFCNNRDTIWLTDLAMIVYYHNYHNCYDCIPKSKFHKLYIRDRNQKFRIMFWSLHGQLSMRIRMDNTGQNLINILNEFYDIRRRIY